MSPAHMLLAAAALGGLALAAGGAGLAQTTQTALGGKHDNKAPIEIKADSLEVEQDKQLATFRGNVDATQAEIRLRADTLIVHYRPKNQVPNAAGKAQPAKPAPAANGAASASSDPFTSGAISHIDAIGHVVVTSPQETAQGDTGYYDVDAQTIELEGSNVILTRCQDVLKGKKAVMHLDTGQSFLDTAPGQRVYGLFIPQQKGVAPPSGPQPACPETAQTTPSTQAKPLKKTPVAGGGK